MAYYSEPEIAHVRHTCHTYLKSIDLTKTGLAVALVDELATIPLRSLGARTWLREDTNQRASNLTRALENPGSAQAIKRKPRSD
jgi:formate dehydrogenase maturation protein FdhE